MTPRQAIVGCGSRGAEHVDALLRLPDTEIAACCDPDPTRLCGIADRFDFPVRAAEVGQLPNAGPPALVHVATMPAVRWQVVQSLIAARPGANLIERPFATLASDARRIFRACSYAGIESLDDPDAHPCGPSHARVSWKCTMAAQSSALLGRPVDPREGASDWEILEFRRQLADNP